MAWPNPPDWTKGEPLSGWYNNVQDATGARVNICATQGRGFIRVLQRKINAIGGVLGPSLTVDGNWGPATQHALVFVANQIANASTGEQQSYMRENETRLAADERSRNISRASMNFALWVAYYLADLRGNASQPLERISAPLNSVFPRFGVTPDDDRGVNGGAVTCWDRDRDRAPTPASREEVDRARETGSTGTTTPPVRGGASGDGTATPARSDSGGSATIWAAVIGGAALLLANRGSKRRGGGGARRRRRR
jgi:hypothetical protein